MPDGCYGWAAGLEPCVPWDQVWNDLLRNGVMTLDDDGELTGRRLHPGEVDEYVVEIQRDGKYRTYSYSDPQRQRWPEARRMLAIALTLRRSFHQCRTLE
jgi:hypothetical protein